jgi:hypothetical protein
MDVGGSSRQHSRGALVDVADIVVPALGPTRVGIDQGGVYPPVLGIVLDADALLAEHSSALPFGRLEIHVLRVVDDLPT